MARCSSNIETAKESLDKRNEKVSPIIRFRKGDEVTLVVTTWSGEEDIISRGTGFRPRGADGLPGEEVLSYKFLLKRGERAAVPVYITLGVFTSLPLVKRGFGPSDSEAQRMGANNAIFDGFYMRSAEDIIANLRRGVICDEVFTTPRSRAQCYRWRLK